MDYFKDVQTTFLGLESVSCIAVYWHFSTTWYDSARYGSERHGMAQFVFPLQFSTALERAGLFTSL